ncbi:hypothetical protein [Paenibacillus sp. JJ778]|uniref:hypothetical protein n=1 Tax=Paenibacillus sp. JJ778 TaxID=3435411 RepID=UPI003D9CB403
MQLSQIDFRIDPNFLYGLGNREKKRTAFGSFFFDLISFFYLFSCVFVALLLSGFGALGLWGFGALGLWGFGEDVVFFNGYFL